MATNRLKTEQKRIQREIERLKKQAMALEQKQRKPVIDQIVRDMKAHNISVEEIAQAFGKGRAGRKSASKGSSAPRTVKTVAPKFKNPDTGETWTGRGRAPRWIVEAEQRGQKRDDFLIDKSPQSTSEPQATDHTTDTQT